MLVGGLSAAYTVLFVVVVALWCFFAGMQWAVGAPAGLIAGAAGVLVVIQQPQPALAAATSALLAVIAGLIPESPTARSLRIRMEQWQQLAKQA